MKRILLVFIQVVDKISIWTKWIALLMLPLMAITSIEVVSRRIFNRPTIWAWDINQQLMCAFIVIGGGYSLLSQSHVRMDLFYGKAGPKGKSILDLLGSLLPLIFLGVLLWEVGNAAWYSISIREKVTGLVFTPPLYPLRILIFLGVFVFLLQAIAEVIRSSLIISGEEIVQDTNQ